MRTQRLRRSMGVSGTSLLLAACWGYLGGGCNRGSTVLPPPSESDRSADTLPEAPVADEPQDGERVADCTEHHRAFASLVSEAAAQRCTTARECTCVQTFLCGAVVHRNIVDSLAPFESAYSATGCGPDVTCAPFVCEPDCIEGRCVNAPAQGAAFPEVTPTDRSELSCAALSRHWGMVSSHARLWGCANDADCVCDDWSNRPVHRAGANLLGAYGARLREARCQEGTDRAPELACSNPTCQRGLCRLRE